MEQDVGVLAVVQERGLHLEKVGVVVDEKVAAQLHGSNLDVFEDSSHFFRIQVVGGKPSMDGCLNGVRGPTNSIPELIFDPGHAGVHNGGTEGGCYDQSGSDLVHGVFNPGDGLGEVLHDLEESARVFLGLEQLVSEAVDLLTIVQSHSGGGNGQR